MGFLSSIRHRPKIKGTVTVLVIQYFIYYHSSLFRQIQTVRLLIMLCCNLMYFSENFSRFVKHTLINFCLFALAHALQTFGFLLQIHNVTIHHSSPLFIKSLSTFHKFLTLASQILAYFVFGFCFPYSSRRFIPLSSPRLVLSRSFRSEAGVFLYYSVYHSSSRGFTAPWRRCTFPLIKYSAYLMLVLLL